MLGIMDQVALLKGIRAEVIELVRVPDAMVDDELEAIATQGEDRWGVREIPFPVILVEEVLAPLGELLLA